MTIATLRLGDTPLAIGVSTVKVVVESENGMVVLYHEYHLNGVENVKKREDCGMILGHVYITKPNK